MMALFRQRLLVFVPTLIRDLQVMPFEASEVELEMVANNDGAFFKPHIDTFTGVSRQASDRILSAVYYFNAEPKAFAGGVLRLYSLGTKAHEGSFSDVQPEQNMLVAFPSGSVRAQRVLAGIDPTATARALWLETQRSRTTGSAVRLADRDATNELA
jgi:Rps23 Pro-64 3,4-dihydroxylase Tpa1-like proline 4-hydroxylase